MNKHFREWLDLAAKRAKEESAEMAIRTAVPEWVVLGCLGDDGGVIVHTCEPRFRASLCSTAEGESPTSGLAYVGPLRDVLHRFEWIDAMPTGEALDDLMRRAFEAMARNNYGNERDRAFEAVGELVMESILERHRQEIRLPQARANLCSRTEPLSK